jgi:dihydrofolate synthase/folylpolyglutamate synthase
MVSMTYAEAVAHLNALGPELAPTTAGAPRRKFDLAHMRRLCAALGDPHTKVPSVLIAGTNGKGSTAATLAAILATAGYRTGLYTSPHLRRVNERIQLSQPALEPIADEEFGRVYGLVDQACERLVAAGELPYLPSFFERLTAIAFTWFAGADLPQPAPRADILVLEVGLGGRLDATNIVEPLVSVITDISLDHQEYLGDTIALIASEKCGILRENGTLVTLSQHPEANQAIGEAAARLNVRGVSAAPFLPPAQRNRPESDHLNSIPWSDALRNRYSVVIEEAGFSRVLKVDSPLSGSHQQRNIALALATACELRHAFGYEIADSALEQGIRETAWPGRLEWIAPNLLLDVAHNPAGAWTLRAAIAALPESRPRTLLFSCLRDKDRAEMSRILFPLFDSSSEPARSRDHIVLAQIPSPRAASLDDLQAAARAMDVPAHAMANPAEALELARSLTPAGGVIVATGSVYLIGELRDLALHISEASEVLA